MDATRVFGLSLLVCGLLIVSFSLWWQRKSQVQRRAKFPVTVVPSAIGGERNFALRPLTSRPGVYHELRLTTNVSEKIEINLGDQFEVYPDPQQPNLARIYRSGSSLTDTLHGLYGVLQIIVGALILRSESFSTTIDSPGKAIGLTIFGAFCSIMGVLGVGLAARMFRDFRNSIKTEGTILEISVIVTAKGARLYQPRVQYLLNGAFRQAWASPRVRSPKIGETIGIRVSGRAPHESIRTTQSALFGLLFLLVFGALGWAFLIFFLVGVLKS